LADLDAHELAALTALIEKVAPIRQVSR
jgi:hypothetical protein